MWQDRGEISSCQQFTAIGTPSCHREGSSNQWEQYSHMSSVSAGHGLAVFWTIVPFFTCYTLSYSCHFTGRSKKQISVDNLRFFNLCPFFLQIWNDYKLRWDPRQYDGIEFVRVPADKIWKPDIVLYNKYDDSFYPFY